MAGIHISLVVILDIYCIYMYAKLVPLFILWNPANMPPFYAFIHASIGQNRGGCYSWEVIQCISTGQPLPTNVCHVGM